MPFISNWSGRIPEGRTSSQPLAFWDMLPTFCDLASVPVPANLDGESMLKPILGGDAISHKPLYWEFHENGFKQAVRWDDWKAVRNRANGPVELYDLKSDLSELHNVAAAHADQTRNAEQLFKALRTDSRTFPI